MSVTNDQLKALKAARPDYRWKVQTAGEYGATLVAYIDARQVMDILDDIVGPANWQRKYSAISGVVYCSLELLIDGRWVEKQDAGSESNMEAEKGQASDAFKRSAVSWGIGRFLYDLDMIRIKDTIQIGKGRDGKPKYAPAYNGQRIWDVDKHVREHGLDKAKTPATDHQRSGIEKAAKAINLTGKEFAEWLSGTVGAKWASLTFDQAAETLKCLQQLKAEGIGA